MTNSQDSSALSSSTGLPRREVTRASNISAPAVLIHQSKSKNERDESSEIGSIKTNYYQAPVSGLEGAATNVSREGHHKSPIFYNKLQRWRYAFREPLAEFFGMTVFIAFGDGVVAQLVLSNGTKGNYTSLAFAWAAAILMGYSVCAGISGAHLNPAVSICAATFRNFPWRKVPGYILAQCLGGYCGALVMYAVYLPAFNNFEGNGVRTVIGEKATAGIFCTFSQPFLSTGGQVVSELVASALLQIGIFSMTDPYNAPFGNSFPFALFVLIYGLGASYGFLTGFALNPARDFGPRLAAATVGYPREMFTAYHHYFWVPLVVPVFGCLIGGFLYDLFIYQGLDSPLNQKNFGIPQRIERIRNFELKSMRPDFEIERSGIHDDEAPA